MDSNDSTSTAQQTVGVSATYDNIYVGKGYKGQVDQSNYKITSTSVLYLGLNAAAAGTYNLSGDGTLVTASEAISRYGKATFNQSGGTHAASGTIYFAQGSGTATYNLSGGSLSAGTELLGDVGTGIFTQTAGTHTINNTLKFGFDGGSGTYNLQGGTLILDQFIVGSGGTNTFNFNGGTLQASSTTTGFMNGLTTAAVQRGGALIDTHGYDIAIGQALLHDSALGTTLDGGLNKSGSGTLTLAGANTYTGATTVGAGTLAINNDGTTTGRLTRTGSIAVNNGGTLLLGGSATVTDRLNDTASVSLSGGGTITTNGLGEGKAPTAPGTGGAVGVGALTLSNSSATVRATVDFGGSQGGSALVFSSLAIGGKGAYVTILNWTGALGSDNGATTNDRLLFVIDPGYSKTDLANWQFSDDQGMSIGTGAAEISYNGYYEIVPVPEPATWLAGALLLGTIGVRMRDRRHFCNKWSGGRF